MTKQIIFSVLLSFIISLSTAQVIEKKEYYDNGQLSGIKHFENEQPTGIWHSFYQNGQLQGTTDYVTGDMIFYYKNGQLRMILRTKDNKMVGESKEYYENGQLKAFTDYNTMEHARYYENGKLEVTGKLDSDGITPTGIWKEYDETGKLVNTKTY